MRERSLRLMLRLGLYIWLSRDDSGQWNACLGGRSDVYIYISSPRFKNYKYRTHTTGIWMFADSPGVCRQPGSGLSANQLFADSRRPLSAKSTVCRQPLLAVGKLHSLPTATRCCRQTNFFFFEL